MSKSFKDVRYTYSRWACTSAAQNIIKLYHTRDPDEPQWWVEQAFVVIAGICMALELFHRTEADEEAQEYQSYVKRAIRFLQLFYTSSVAVHGARLLLSLLEEYEKSREGSNAKSTPSMDTRTSQSFSSVADNIIDMPTANAARATHQTPLDPEIPFSFDDPTIFNFDIEGMGFEDLMDYLPSEGLLNSNVFQATMLSANGWPTW
jgi:transcription elongation factor SPT5